MPQDTRLIYSAQRDTGAALMMKSPTGEAPEILFEDKAHNLFPLSVSPDGMFLLYNEVARAMQGKLGVRSRCSMCEGRRSRPCRSPSSSTGPRG
jgi:hypothetical protein